MKYRRAKRGVVLQDLHVLDEENVPLIEMLAGSSSKETFVILVNQAALRRTEIARIAVGEFHAKFSHGRSLGSQVIASAAEQKWPTFTDWITKTAEEVLSWIKR